MPHLLSTQNIPFETYNLTKQIKDLDNQLRGYSAELEALFYPSVYEQSLHVENLSGRLTQLSFPLNKLMKKVNSLLERDLPENLLGQVDALSYQLEDFN